MVWILPDALQALPALDENAQFSAPLPVPTMMAVGVARPRAQGQAMTITATKLSRARLKTGSSPGQHPYHEGQHGDADDGGYEDGGHPVGQALDGGLGALGFFHHADDLGQHGIPPHTLGAEAEAAGAVDGGPHHLVAGVLLHRDGFAGEHGLVHRACPFQQHAVHRDLLARAHHDDLLHHHFFYGDVHLFAVAYHPRRPGLQAHQAADGVVGLPLARASR